MAVYTYYCEFCCSSFELHRNFTDCKPQESCKICNKLCNRDYQSDLAHFSVRLHLSEIKKLGHYAARQTKKIGKEKSELMFQDFKTKKKNKELPPGMTRMTKEDWINKK